MARRTKSKTKPVKRRPASRTATKVARRSKRPMKTMKIPDAAMAAMLVTAGMFGTSMLGGVVPIVDKRIKASIMSIATIALMTMKEVQKSNIFKNLVIGAAGISVYSAGRAFFPKVPALAGPRMNGLVPGSDVRMNGLVYEPEMGDYQPAMQRDREFEAATFVSPGDLQ